MSGELLPPSYLGGPDITGENCEREAIHIPGSVQPHGALLVVRAETEGTALEVVQASENLSAFLGISAEQAAGQTLAALLGEPVSQAIALALPPGTPDVLQYRTTIQTQPVAAASVPLALTAHRAGNRVLLELEQAQSESQSDQNRLRNALFALESAESLQQLAEVTVAAVRDLSGFDRVMLYRFAPDNSGEVIAESCRSDLEPFLGHRFPESDIPAQARALYVRHLLRLTADVTAQPSPLLPRTDPQSGQPTPLGGAVLRATSPMHVQYLKNMGVASSLSVSIVVEGRLWGLISCHHTSPYITPPGVRSALEDLGRLLNLQVQLKMQADVAAFRATLREGHQRVLSRATHTLSPLETLSDPALGLRELLSAGGLALRLEGEWRTLGQVPSHEALNGLLEWLRANVPTSLFVTDYLQAQYPAAGGLTGLASGLLAVSIGRGWQEALLWLRGEHEQVTRWGGATPDQAKTDLGPRQSFATYLERVRGHSQPWHPGEVAEAEALGQNLTAALGERLSTLRTLNAELSRSNEEWRKFAFVISHDMQEPVRLIMQFMELFGLRQGGQLDDQTKKLMEFVTRETARLGSLTSDLYAYTELLSYPELHLQRVDLSELLDNCMSSLTGLAAQKSLQWTGPDERVTLTADRAKLQVALTQLLHNALTFSAAPVSIAVGVSQDAYQTHLTIQDNGPGVPEEFQERIFGLFQRLGARDAGGGNGMGLPLARKVTQLHGGRLTLTSAPGEGTTLCMSLPHRAGAGP